MTREELEAAIAAANETTRRQVQELMRLGEIRSLTPEQQDRWNRLTAAHDAQVAQIEAMRDELRSVIAGGVSNRTFEVLSGDGATAGASQSDRGPQLMRTRSLASVWSPLQPGESIDEIRSRSRHVIERYADLTDRGRLVDTHPVTEDRQAVLDELARLDDGSFGRYVLATSDPAYQAAFRGYLRGEAMYWSDEERHAVRKAQQLKYTGPEMRASLAEGRRIAEMRFGRIAPGADDEVRASLAEGNTGALMLPFQLDPTIMLTNTGAINPFRQIARVESITTNAWHGVTSAGVSAEWSAESAQVADATPSLVQPAIVPVRGDAHVQVTMEQLQDSDISEQLAGMMADAKDRLEAVAFAVGTGSTQPTGVITTLAATTASRVTSSVTATYSAVDVFNVDNGLNARYRPNAAWLAHWAVWNATRQFSTTVAPQASAFWANMGPGVPEQLLGRNIYEASAMTSSVITSTAQVLVLGDFTQGFCVVDRVGISILVNPYVVGGSGRPIGETGFTAFFRTGSGVTNADAFRMLVLK